MGGRRSNRHTRRGLVGRIFGDDRPERDYDEPEPEVDPSLELGVNTALPPDPTWWGHPRRNRSAF